MKRPLVLTASARAIEQARALGLTRPLENLIEEAIIRGDLPGASVGKESPVRIGDGLVCVCAKVRVRPSERKAWRPISLRLLDARRRAV